MKTTRHKATICLACLGSLDASTSPGRAVPKRGDVSICLYCGNIAIYRGDRTLRRPTEAEAAEIAASETIQHMLRVQRETRTLQ